MNVGSNEHPTSALLEEIKRHGGTQGDRLKPVPSQCDKPSYLGHTSLNKMLVDALNIINVANGMDSTEESPPPLEHDEWSD